MARPTDKQYENDDDRTATFRIPHGKLVAFQEICSKNEMSFSQSLIKFVDGVISAGGFSWEPKPSPDKFITHEDIAPLVARIEALEKGSSSSFDFLKDEPDIYTAKDGEPIPDPTPSVDESPKSCFDLVGTVSEVAEVPAQNEQILESPGEKPDISDPTISEVPGTITEDFSQKTIDEVLNSRGDAPPEPWFDKDSCDIYVENQARFWDGQLTHWTDTADALEISRNDFEEYSVLEKFKKEVETVQCLNGNLYRWIGEIINPVEETDD